VYVEKRQKEGFLEIRLSSAHVTLLLVTYSATHLLEAVLHDGCFFGWRVSEELFQESS
jgi:hypothetical protein